MKHLNSKRDEQKPLPAPKHNNLRESFHVCAQKTAFAAGTPWAFIIALLGIIAWVVTGPLFHYSDTWQLVINTATTIITFLMVFLIQNTQNRDTKALHLKLDELLRGVKGARTSLIDLEHLSDEELEELQKQFDRISSHAPGKSTGSESHRK